MSFVVRDTFPYKNKYFSETDNIKQQLTDYLMHEYLAGRQEYELSGSYSLQDVIEIKEALDASPLINATIVVDEIIDTENPDMSSRTIKYTKL